jgi:hypothetical protein
MISAKQATSEPTFHHGTYSIEHATPTACINPDEKHLASNALFEPRHQFPTHVHFNKYTFYPMTHTTFQTWNPNP